MVQKTVTSVSRANPPETHQVGPFMRHADIWKYVTINDLAATVLGEVKVLASEGIVHLDYSTGVTNHRASIVLNDTGLIQCTYCTLAKPVVWCPHLHYIARQQFDTPLFTALPIEPERSVTVPIIPTEGVFAPMEFTRLMDTKPDYALVTMPCSRVDDDSIGEDVELGIVQTKHFGIATLRALFIDTYTGRCRDPELFYQGVRGPEGNDAFSEAVRRFNGSISEFSQLFYETTFGKTFGELQMTGTDDAPKF